MAKTQLKYNQLKLNSNHFSTSNNGQIDIKDDSIDSSKLDHLFTASGGTVGQYGTEAKVGSFTVDAQGRLTAATDIDILIDHGQVSDFDTGVRENSIDQLGSAAANVSMGSFRLTDLANGTNAGDAINKSQLDAAIAGLRWKEPVLSKEQISGAVDAASFGSGTLAFTYTDHALFGQHLQVGDRVLCVEGDTQAEYNGIWEVEQQSQGAGIEIRVESNDPAKIIAGGDTLIRMTVLDESQSAKTTELILSNVLADGVTGTLDSFDRVIVQLNGLTTAEDIRDEIKAGFEDSNSPIAPLITAAPVDDIDPNNPANNEYKLDIKAKFAASPNGLGAAFGGDVVFMSVNTGNGQSFIPVASNNQTTTHNLNAGQGLRVERPEYADSAEELVSAAVFVINEDEAYTCIEDEFVLNTDAMAWVQFTGLGNITAGKGISKSQNTLDIEILREDDEVLLAAGVHTFSSTHAQSYWEAVGSHPMTMVYLNGVLLEQAADETDVGTGGDYFIQYGSGNEIKLDTNLAISGDKITIIHASMV